ncbi:DNA-processing protein DprA [Tepidibacter formicigenes]|jgi:DNA processing protein|uniref:DNA processing protein n=1 Tax=Tepidibacter formicigenes DSM 15518 TaxID=1123349 RepID=A0A1M6RDJ0_9FIRM|nr:DNA-processing protein DprA [Tepidibacter formicigenes]SHK30513.1 DNA processing protein [Tepidibacter formicigenes DSM 15518]
MKIDDIYLLLWHIKGVGYKTINKLEDYFNGLENFNELDEAEIYKIPNMSLKTKENIVNYRSSAYLEIIKENLHKNNINYITINNPRYPQKLKNIYDPPYVLFVKGNIDILNDFSIAMVGSRKPTRYGIWCAKKFSKELSSLGVNIISGMAIGIDSYSHLGCLNSKGKTIAVLGSSIDKPYPKENIKLMNDIVESGGAVVCEYPLETLPRPGYFPMRNRIISGICDGVLIVEAGEKSGSLITMDYALEHGKNIFSIPGNINSYMSKGTNKIIKEGAKLITCVDDILEEYDIFYDKTSTFQYKQNIDLSQDEYSVVNSLSKYGSLHVDLICKYTKLHIKDILGILNILEIKGIVTELGNKIYNINNLQ